MSSDKFDGSALAPLSIYRETQHLVRWVKPLDVISMDVALKCHREDRGRQRLRSA